MPDLNLIAISVQAVGTLLVAALRGQLPRVLPGAYVNDGNGPGDCRGHGTHVAGLIGGETFGVAKDVSFVPAAGGGVATEDKARAFAPAMVTSLLQATEPAVTRALRVRTKTDCPRFAIFMRGASIWSSL